MARINFEDDVEAQDEFWNLLQLAGGDRDRALGKLLRFFRLAQKAYGHGEPMTLEELSEKGFEDMVKSGWARPVDGGFYALGSEKHFDWYRQRVGAGKERAKSERDKSGRFTSQNTPADTSGTPAVDQRNSIPYQPLALSPAPSPSKKLNTENAFGCFETWVGTIQHFGGSRKTLNDRDQVKIARAIQKWGAESVDLALYGARYEPKTESFNPANYVSLDRIFERDKTGKERFDLYVQWGDRARKVETLAQIKEAKAHEEAEIERTDPAKVREILSKAFGGVK